MHAAAVRPLSPPPARRTLAAAALLTALVLLAWANAFRAPYELDDDS